MARQPNISDSLLTQVRKSLIKELVGEGAKTPSLEDVPSWMLDMPEGEEGENLRGAAIESELAKSGYKVTSGSALTDIINKLSSQRELARSELPEEDRTVDVMGYGPEEQNFLQEWFGPKAKMVPVTKTVEDPEKLSEFIKKKRTPVQKGITDLSEEQMGSFENFLQLALTEANQAAQGNKDVFKSTFREYLGPLSPLFDEWKAARKAKKAGVVTDQPGAQEGEPGIDVKQMSDEEIMKNLGL